LNKKSTKKLCTKLVSFVDCWFNRMKRVEVLPDKTSKALLNSNISYLEPFG
jgi:hypothetical protein